MSRPGVYSQVTRTGLRAQDKLKDQGFDFRPFVDKEQITFRQSVRRETRAGATASERYYQWAVRLSSVCDGAVMLTLSS